MSDKPQRTITIWFFVGALFAVYGVLITGCGIYGLFHPPEVVKAEYNVTLWWGIFLTVFGVVFTIRFWPRKEQLTGESGGETKGK
ncbi:MAG: hypothetical protein JW719_10375 [Pirellulales bacterium]|nr:hypothetical protein [Pirellulales bacterium]